MNDNLRIVIETKTSTFPGSGEGYGSIVDRDVVFDDKGLPYLPARRLKGVLRESALEVQEMLGSSKLMTISPEQLNRLFGKEGQTEGSRLIITDFFLDGYAELLEWLNWLFSKYPAFFSPAAIIDYYTEIRHQTSIAEQGVAEEGSLRTSRVLKKDLCFEGRIGLADDNNQEEKTILALACANMRHLGGQRNRGFGEVTATLFAGTDDLTASALKELAEKGEG